MRRHQKNRLSMKPVFSGTGSHHSAILLVILLAAIWLYPTSGQADESISQENPTPGSVDEVLTPIDISFMEKLGLPGLFPRLKEKLQDTPPFFRDSKLDLNARSFYFYKDNYDNKKNEAWALGGALSYKSGWLADHFALGAVLYTSLPLYAPDDRDGTRLLAAEQEDYTSLGQIYGRIRFAGSNYLNLYRYEYNTPYLNKDDGRMSPKTFEGYTITGTQGKSGNKPTWQYGGGYITRIKDNNSDEFVWMSQKAGAPIDRGVAVGGMTYNGEKITIGLVDYYCDDVLNIGYGEAKYITHFSEKLGLLTALQYSDQRSVGDDRQTGDSFSTGQIGVKADMSYAGAIFTIGYTQADDGADLQKPWSSYPGYTSSQILDFNRADEKAVMLKLSYDFTSLGLDGVTAYTQFVQGWDRISLTPGKTVSDEHEIDFDLQWKPTKGILKGFWPRIRYAVANEDDAGERYVHDFRVILNYDISFL
ncbi:MAG: OprD family outer membrane porin [Desulfatirhabdiaceae bacterium]